jgi:hypothetical protein
VKAKFIKADVVALKTRMSFFFRPGDMAKGDKPVAPSKIGSRACFGKLNISKKGANNPLLDAVRNTLNGPKA